MEVNRRKILAGLGASLGAAMLGCTSDRSGVAATPDGATPADAPSPDAIPPSAQELLAGIETIVVLCMENRSFDHYLGSLRLVEGRADIDGLTGTESNPAPDGSIVPVHLLENPTPADPPHDWDPCHEQWNDGANDGFVRAHAGPDQADVMGYHTRAMLPATYALADAGAICQRWFCSLLGPTWPNRYYLHAASSKGQKTNLPVTGIPTIWDRLDDAGIANLNYFHDVAWVTGSLGKLGGLASIDQFFTDAAAGNLPPFAVIDPAFFGGGANDDHPDHDIRMGQALIASVASAIAQSPQWSRCLFVLTYDEHGGFFDHVPPPAPPVGSEQDPDWRRLGFRVPSIAIGPTVRRGAAVNTVFEHSSIATTATLRYGLEPLNARAVFANDLSPVIDPARLDDPLPPPIVPPIAMSMRALAARQARGDTGSHSELRPYRVADSDAVVRRVLARGAELGAVQLVD